MHINLLFVNSHYSYKLFSFVSDLPLEWDDLSVSNVFLSKNYLSVLESSAPKNMNCHFIGLFDQEKLIGIALSQFIDLSTITSYGDRDHCIKTIVRNYVFKKFSSKLLFIGNNMLTGQNGYSFDSNLSHIEGLTLLKLACNEIQNNYLASGVKIHLTIFKDYDLSEANQFSIPPFKSFFKFTTQPNMIFKINPDWATFEDYYAALHKKYRDQYKRAKKKSESLIKKKMTLHEIQKESDTINELYLNVANNAPFNTFFLPENHFEVFKSALNDSFLFYGYYKQDQLIGFNTLIKNGNVIDTYFLGYNEKFQRDYLLYLNMLYDMIGYSIKKGYSEIIFARTALEIKSSVGAKPIKMVGFMKHSNPLINFFISKLFSYFEPEIVWKERNPFK